MPHVVRHVAATRGSEAARQCKGVLRRHRHVSLAVEVQGVQGQRLGRQAVSRGGREGGRYEACQGLGDVAPGQDDESEAGEGGLWMGGEAGNKGAKAVWASAWRTSAGEGGISARRQHGRIQKVQTAWKHKGGATLCSPAAAQADR